MATTTLNPFLGDRDAPAERRLDALRMRTVLVCVLAMGCAVLAISLGVAPVARVLSHLYALALRQGELPPAHVPWAGADEFEAASPVGLLMLLLALAWIGLSLGSFGTLKARWVMLPPALLCLAIVVFAPPSLGGLRIWPSALERDIMHGRLEAAESAVAAGRHADVNRHYVLAQIAVRARDGDALQRHGTAALNHAQRYVYGAGSPAAGRFEPRVVHAIDVAMHGQPQTEVGQRVAGEGLAARGLGHAADALRVLLSAALLVACAALAWTWNGMRRRVANIQTGLAGQRPAADAQAAPQPADPTSR